MVAYFNATTVQRIKSNGVRCEFNDKITLLSPFEASFSKHNDVNRTEVTMRTYNTNEHRIYFKLAFISKSLYNITQ